MNLAIRGIDSGQIAQGDTFHNDRHPDLKADFILANPPFNISDWGGERLRGDLRWQYGVPPAGNANFAWVQDIVHHLAPAGVAGFVLANGSMSSNQSGEGEIRKSLIEADLVDCMVALPGQLFYSTQIPACLWFLARDKSARRPREGGDPASFRDRHGHILFIDARKLGPLVDRTHRELTDDDIARIASTYHAWRDTSSSPLPQGEGQGEGHAYADVPGFSKSASLDEVRKHGHVLTPGRYVGAGAVKDDGETLEAMARALFKSWFVDFDPVRAKAEGRDPGLPKPLADLFPARLVDSELGEIPEGWEIKPVGDLADAVGGTTPGTKAPSYWEGGTHAWATPKGLSRLSVPVLLGTERRITDAGLSQVGSGLLPKGTVLLSSRAPIGYLAVAELPVAINQGFIAMVATAGTSNLFLLLWASVAHEDIVSRANGSTFLEISKANFRPSTDRVPEGAELPRAARSRVQGLDAADSASGAEWQRQVHGVRRFRLSRRVLRAGAAPSLGQARPGEGAKDAWR